MLKTAIIAFIIFLPFNSLFAQEIYNEYQGTYRAKVLNILSEEIREVSGTDIENNYQIIEAEILNGPEKGKAITVENDYFELKIGDKFYYNYNVDIDGTKYFAIVNIDRINSLLLLLTIFFIVVISFGGIQGFKSLIALIGSFLAIFYILIPSLINGWNPIVTSLLVSSGILFVAIFFTHGFNKLSLVAYVGTMLAVLITSIFAIFAVYGSDLTGFYSDESVYLNINTGGSLNFISLLLGAIIIGVLGVLDDIAITQASVVHELFDSNHGISRREVYKRAIRVGREHVSALVNTLVLAYTGASLPLLLYFHLSPTSFLAIINSEIFATEIVRIIVGSIGLIITVPIVTLLAVFYLKDLNNSKDLKSHIHKH